MKKEKGKMKTIGGLNVWMENGRMTVYVPSGWTGSELAAWRKENLTEILEFKQAHPETHPEPTPKFKPFRVKIEHPKPMKVIEMI